MNGYWICADDKPDASRLYYFEHMFDAKASAKMTASICADSRYRLYVNGEFVCDGPCRGSQYQRFYEQPDLTTYLKEGENKITVEVLYLTENTFISVMRDLRPALWFSGVLYEDGVQTDIYSDENWSCKRLDTHIFHNTNIFYSLPPIENVLGEDSYTDMRVCRMYEPDLQSKCFNICGVREKYPLVPRTIPLMKPDVKKQFAVVKKGKDFVELDAGVYTTAIPEMFFKGTVGSKLSVRYAECYCKEDGKKGVRDDSTGVLNGFCDTVVLTGKKQKFAPFWFRAFRFIRLEFEDENFEFDIEQSGYCVYFYPLDQQGSFECSDERLNRIWDISKNTVRCCMHEIFVDCPYYEQQQYGMDSALETLFTMRMTSDVRLIKKTIIDFVHSQLPDGMLQANFPSLDVQVIPTFSLFWLLMVREYLRYTGDIAFVKPLTGTIDKVLTAFDSLLTKEGLVGATHYWHFTDWVPNWYAGIPDGGREEPLTVGCLIYATALGAAAEICEECGRIALAGEYKERQAAMNSAVNKYCFDEAQGMYRDTPSRRNFSEHTALWAVLSGAATGDNAAKLIDSIMNNDVSRCTFSMNHYMFRALEKADRYCYSSKLMAGWQKMLDLHCTTWCENPDDPRSECHGWSSAPIYEMSAMVLGVYPDSNGYKSVRIKPVFDSIDWAKGTVPTPYGVISVEWKKQDGKIVLDIETPQNADMPMTVILPGAEALSTNEHNVHLEV